MIFIFMSGPRLKTTIDSMKPNVEFQPNTQYRFPNGKILSIPILLILLICCDQPLNVFTDVACRRILFRQVVNDELESSGERLINSKKINHTDNKFVRKHIQRHGWRQGDTGVQPIMLSSTYVQKF